MTEKKLLKERNNTIEARGRDSEQPSHCPLYESFFFPLSHWEANKTN